jgi:ferredoxin-fold anticodon binding domain-containing protein
MRYSVEQIKRMSEEEWNEFRNESWNAKKEKTSGPIPTWYLRDKEGYVSFMKAQKEKNDSTGKEFHLDINSIEAMSEQEWQDYREKSWARRNANYSSDTAPEWFMKDKDQYVSFLVKHNIR